MKPFLDAKNADHKLKQEIHDHINQASKETCLPLESIEVPSLKASIDILYEVSGFLVCYKPAGLAVQTARPGEPDLENTLKNYLYQKAPDNPPYLAVIHRLDQPVEGLLLFAKTPQAARELNRQLTAGTIRKRYLAVSDHSPKEPEAVLSDHLYKDGRKHLASVVDAGTPGAKPARLSYRFLEKIPDERVATGNRYLFQIRLDTGRFHQIRVQMSNAGLPLVGDRKYYPEDKSGLPLGLCASELDFIHPVTRKKMHFQIIPKGECFQNSKELGTCQNG